MLHHCQIFISLCDKSKKVHETGQMNGRRGFHCEKERREDKTGRTKQKDKFMTIIFLMSNI